MMKERQREPREIHYELVPRRERQNVSACKLLFASIVGIVIIALIAFLLLLLFSIYIRPTPPPSYIPGKDINPIGIRPPTRRPVPRGKKSLQLFVVYHQDNLERARDVEAYLNNSLGSVFGKNFDFSIGKLSSPNLNQANLQITVPERTLLRSGSLVVFVSELMAPGAAQIEEMIKGDHRTCTKLDVARCVEICSVTTGSTTPSFLSPANITFDGVSIDIPNLVDVVQDSVIYRQLSADRFSLARRSRGCVVYA
ncbi:uncharacterized protein LOC100905711 [Galendromus occidentalis]|uniref:Uncharacterized protein LOC100905711 n=1 Tax=Galendromus occidentalis TaxID=34638 RepID=A0AAJ6QMH2_9ACAR|nr:uncharacterized protein LOC100905711 [Galendromus occidentalis]